MIAISQSRKMRQLLSSVLLASLCSPSSWSDFSDMLTIHTSRSAVQEGDQIDITCCLNSTMEGGYMECLRDQERIGKQYVILKQQSCVTFTLKNTTTRDSGTYSCSTTIDIPIYKKLTGNGTVIIVRPPTDKPDDGDYFLGSSLPIIAAAASLVILFMVLFVCSWRWRQEKAATVIYEVPCSEGPEIDKHSTASSTGSTQWCQVTVYESIDYFVHVDTKSSD